jgi:hypothetical protein
VRFIKDDKVVGLDIGALECGEHRLAGQRVDAADHRVAIVARERVRRSCIGASHDPKAQAEESAELALPVAQESGRRNDEHPANEAARLHLANVKPRHDRLAGTGIVGKEEAQARLGEHVLVHRDALMGQRFDAGRFGGEGRARDVTVGESLDLGDQSDAFGISQEVRRAGWRLTLGSSSALVRWSRCRLLGLEMTQLPQELAGRLGLSSLPAVHGDERHAKAGCQGGLCQSEATPSLANQGAAIHNDRSVHNNHG